MRVPTRRYDKKPSKLDPYITLEKKEKLEKELIKLKKIDRPIAIEEMQLAASDGDFSENAPYQAAKWKLRKINNSILKIENMLINAEIIKKTKKSNSIKLGSYVTLKFNNTTKQFQILGSSETNPSKGIISHQSPLGLALMSKQVGDTVKIKTNNKTINYEIIKIS